MGPRIPQIIHYLFERIALSSRFLPAYRMGIFKVNALYLCDRPTPDRPTPKVDNQQKLQQRQSYPTATAISIRQPSPTDPRVLIV